MLIYVQKSDIILIEQLVLLLLTDHSSVAAYLVM